MLHGILDIIGFLAKKDGNRIIWFYIKFYIVLIMRKSQLVSVDPITPHKGLPRLIDV